MPGIVQGVVLSVFDEKAGPDASAWCPDGVPPAVLNDVSSRTINLAFDHSKLPRSLAVIPLPEHRMKALVKYFVFPSANRRGGVGDCTLSMLFKEHDDSIMYKYMQQFEALFDKHAPALVSLQASDAGHGNVKETIQAFSTDAGVLVDELHAVEMQARAPEAFPEAPAPTSLRKFKVIVYGDPEVGKTSLVLQFTDKAFNRTHIPTIGVNITEKQVIYKDVAFKFVIWDIAGQAKFMTIRKHFYEGAMAKILVFDLACTASLESIPRWDVDVTKYIGGDLAGILIGNKNDLVEAREVPRETGIKTARSLGLEYIETSAKTGDNVDDSFERIASFLFDKYMRGTA